MITLSTEPIDTHALSESVRDRDAGAVVIFQGTVRELTAGVRTDHLEYEAYPEMAVRSLEELEQQVRDRFRVIRVAIAHRVGKLEPGEVSVVIAVSSPHRAQAFEAARWLIDTLKERVPVWKKEFYSDGRTEWQHPGTGQAETRPTGGI